MQDANAPLRGCAECADLFAVASLGPNQTMAFLDHRRTHDIPVPSPETQEFPERPFSKETTDATYLSPAIEKGLSYIKLCRQLIRDLKRINELRNKWNDAPFVDHTEAQEYRDIEDRAATAHLVYRSALAYDGDDQPVEQLGLFPSLSDDTQHNGTLQDDDGPGNPA